MKANRESPRPRIVDVSSVDGLKDQYRARRTNKELALEAACRLDRVAEHEGDPNIAELFSTLAKEQRKKAGDGDIALTRDWKLYLLWRHFFFDQSMTAASKTIESHLQRYAGYGTGSPYQVHTKAGTLPQTDIDRRLHEYLTLTKGAVLGHESIKKILGKMRA